jgi:NADH dehydrogenase FAD-containing subunit
MRRFEVLLVGGGHSNLAVLADFARRTEPTRFSAALITPQPFLTYSGMVPGWIAGEHGLDDGRVDLSGLADRAGVELLLDRCVGIAADGHHCILASGEQVRFDWAAIDTGGMGRGARILGDDPRMIDVRPMDDFAARLASWRDANRAGGKRIAVIGGGAGGVELAFGLRNMAGLTLPCEVTLVTGAGGLLPGFAPRLQRLAADELARQGIALAQADARIADGCLMAGEKLLEPLDLIVAAIGSAAPQWPRESGLACDAAGFIAVDRHQRSLSHPHILAAGDVAARVDTEVPRSGVHAVHTGPVLAANLRALMTGGKAAASYRPRPASLYLMSTGNGSALASYGPLAAQGAWAARLKRWIDTRWIAAYAKLTSR